MLSAHEIATFLGPSKALVLPVFHALTGCDTVLPFIGHGKNLLGNVELFSRNDCVNSVKNLASTVQLLPKVSQNRQCEALRDSLYSSMTEPVHV